MSDFGMQKQGGIYCRKRVERTANNSVRNENVGFIKYTGVGRKVGPVNINGNIEF